MPMPNLTILRTYAQKVDVSSLPASILFAHNASSLTIFDAYPKAIFHFLLLPRILSSSGQGHDVTIKVESTTIAQPLRAAQLSNLQSLFKADKMQAKDLILGLQRDAKEIRSLIEEEMMSRYGFKWDIYTGFHAVPSMEHLHLHIFSSDLCSRSLKNKKHYNSFHPKLGFFLHLDDVLTWFDGDDAHFLRMAELKKNQYEGLLKQELSCLHCNNTMKNIPSLKAHLQEEFDKLQTKAKDKAKIEDTLQKKRKRQIDDAPTSPAGNEDRGTSISKRRQTDTDGSQ